MQIHSNAIVTNSKMLKLTILLSLVFININLKSEILSPTVEFTVPLNAKNGPNEPFTPMVHYNNNTYLVYVDANCRPLVVQKTCDATIVTVPLDSNPDYTAYPDGHHRFSMGIDENGYLHVAGDMHYYPTVPADYLPLRYQNQTIMYWVSNAPNDITKGFTFAGGLNASTAIPGQFWNTGHFFNDNKRVLYYTGMIRSVYDPNVRLTGEMGVGLYKYNTASHSWTALGAKPPVNPLYTPATQYFTSLYWDYSGFGSQAGQAQWFNNYWPAFQFDNQNTLHFSLSVNTNPAIAGATRVVYAKSFDGGSTWYKANGKTLISLPLGGIDGNPRLAEVVADFGTTLIGVNSNVVADSTGKAAVNIEMATGQDVWYNYNGTSWTNAINNPTQLWGYNAVLGKNGKITNNAFDRLGFRRSSSLSGLSAAYMLYLYLPLSQLNSFICMSQIGSKTSDDVYGIGLSNTLNNIQVIKLNFATGGMPCNWSYSDIGSDITLGGVSDYVNGTYTLRSSGSGLAYTATDSFTYTYRTLVGDGTIIARVATQIPLQYIGGSTTGVMIRQSLKNYTDSVFMGIGVSGYSQFIYRNALNSVSQVSATANVTVPQWVKLVRSGNLFSGFISADGVTWTQVGNTQSIVMNDTVYVGLASYSSHLPEVFTSTVDNVAIISGLSYVTPSGTGTTGS
ncbi:MAG: BNR-4 repeat-containing protein [Candidatus Babeliales bacterium]|nr:BNR-4 repeat-containing protein [Candidatus Babeliales bacterium]